MPSTSTRIPGREYSIPKRLLLVVMWTLASLFVMSIGAAIFLPAADEPPPAAPLAAPSETTKTPSTSPSPSEKASKPRLARHVTPKPKPSPTATPKPKPKPAPMPDPRFDTCEDAIDHGFGPYIAGADPEYAWYIDSDGDGRVCEP